MEQIRDLAHLKQLVRDVCTTNHDRKNPVGDYHSVICDCAYDEDGERGGGCENGCLYTGPDGTHCIAGTIFANLGADLTDTEVFTEGIGAAVIAVRLGLTAETNTPVAILLATVQGAADNPGENGVPPWSEVLHTLQEAGKV